jgi:hypothetical protein
MAAHRLKMHFKALSPGAMMNGSSVLEKYCAKRYGKDYIKSATDGPAQLVSCSDRLKSVYEKLGLKYVLLIALLTAYGMLGGLIFWHIEGPFEEQMLLDRRQQNMEVRFRWCAFEVMSSGIMYFNYATVSAAMR